MPKGDFVGEFELYEMLKALRDDELARPIPGLGYRQSKEPLRASPWSP